ncbi:Sec-independent protein translocase subunit TatA/TatB [Halodesulfurarchaeum formicicum]|uniref:Twin-arginine translocation protein, TatA/E family subunit n=2 Tax=Halodesulfurarchaeum formicicum TaxID=1873524 RepID=A0A1J1AAW7_9EURY|nr:twin-arginine translocase TatA/TatE family subunit [Halodesulfurarchaeum formicicum]APE95286.1 twin-arginine translocation protein, TatA/E family subunit [Halodesulfurarchaeum formicicum]
MTIEVLPAFGLPAGGMELAIILLIAVLLFGANKIPKLARSTGQAMGEFQRGREEIEQELEEIKEGPEESDRAVAESESESESERTEE